MTHQKIVLYIFIFLFLLNCGQPDQFGDPSQQSSSSSSSNASGGNASGVTTQTNQGGGTNTGGGTSFDCPPVYVQGIPLVCFPAAEQEIMKRTLDFMAQDTNIYPRIGGRSMDYIKKDGRLRNGIIWHAAKSAPTIPDQALAVYYIGHFAMYIKPTLNDFSIFILASAVIHEAAHFDIGAHSCSLWADKTGNEVYGLQIEWLADLSVKTDKMHCFDRLAHYLTAAAMDRNQICEEPKVNVLGKYPQPQCVGGGSGSTGPTAGSP